MRSDIQSSLDAIKAPAQAIITKVDNIPAAVEAGEQQAFDEGKAEGDTVGFNRGKIEGYNLGLAENVNVPDGTFTEQEVINARAEGDAAARAELQPQLDEKQAAIDSLNAQITDLNTKLLAAGPDAVAAFKADLKSKYAAQQVAETEGETGFSSLLD